jgi:23S rRNA (adenine2503-C2)-methyltransferase
VPFPDLLRPLVEAGAKPEHVSRLVRVWLRGKEIQSGTFRARRMPPVAVLQLLPEIRKGLEQLITIVSSSPAEDGGCRMLLRLEDQQTIESVLLPRDALCVSTQVGCAVGCTFCQTGRNGLSRGLTTAEILAQIVLARRQRPVRRVVFMGMGEPAHNLEAVLEAITILGVEGEVGHKELVFSTVGDPVVFQSLLAQAVKPALALSLHTTHRSLRTELLPRAPKSDPRLLVTAALEYADRTGHPLQIQWTLLAGVNDGDDELERLIPWLKGRRAVVNFIPFNPVEGTNYGSTSRARTHTMTRRLHAAGITAKLRRSIAAGVDGGCGQLRGRLSR